MEPDTEYDDIAEQGAYVFTPVLPDSYTCAKGVDLPEIYVRIGSVNAVLANDPNDENNDGYHDGDVAAIIAMIDGNGLLRDKDTPGNWKGGNMEQRHPEKNSSAVHLQRGSVRDTGRIRSDGTDQPALLREPSDGAKRAGQLDGVEQSALLK